MRRCPTIFPAIAAGLFALGSCSRGPVETPEVVRADATPAPSPPRDIYVPNQRLDTARLFSDMTIKAEVDTEPGRTATLERDDRANYALHLQVRAKIPVASTRLEEFTAINPQLPVALPALEALLASAKVSPFYAEIYRLKIASLEHNLVRLDDLLSRHNFYDCETMLELTSPTTKREALLIQSDMDVDTDGSDGDRAPDLGSAPVNFQPMTSYKWPKKTSVPNPFLATSQDRLRKLEQDRAASGLTPAKIKDLNDAIGAAKYEVEQLKKQSFLVSALDPYVALPASMVGQLKTSRAAPMLGDYCVVIFGGQIFPAIVGDVGPSLKIGEASLRLSLAINERASSMNRPVSELAVTYLIFPGSAEKPPAPPDFGKWRARCQQLLTEMGGAGGELHTWEDLAKRPEPSPAPSASPTASASASPEPSASPSPEK